MPSTNEKSFGWVGVSGPGGAGGEPFGETPATASSSGQRGSRVGERLIGDAVDRARLRSMVKRADGERIPDEVIDGLLAGACTEEEIAGPGGLLAELTKRLVERAMEVELTDHVGYEPHQEPPGGAGNTRNGTTPKTLIWSTGRSRSTRRGTGTGALSRRSSESASGALRGLTTRSSRSTAAGCRRATSPRTCRRSTASRSAAT